MRRPYLGTSLDPTTYYRECSEAYDNPHAAGIRILLKEFAEEITGTVLDMGCGNGLVTRVLSPMLTGPFIGVDIAPKMVERYRRETGFGAHEKAFWDVLPPADTAVACYSLHHCPSSLLHLVGARLVEAGVRTVVLISPLKRPWALPRYTSVREVRRNVGPDGKTIFGRVFKSDLV